MEANKRPWSSIPLQPTQPDSPCEQLDVVIARKKRHGFWFQLFSSSGFCDALSSCNRNCTPHVHGMPQTWNAASWPVVQHEELHKQPMRHHTVHESESVRSEAPLHQQRVDAFGTAAAQCSAPAAAVSSPEHHQSSTHRHTPPPSSTPPPPLPSTMSLPSTASWHPRAVRGAEERSGAATGGGRLPLVLLGLVVLGAATWLLAKPRPATLLTGAAPTVVLFADAHLIGPQYVCCTESNDVDNDSIMKTLDRLNAARRKVCAAAPRAMRAGPACMRQRRAGRSPLPPKPQRGCSGGACRATQERGCCTQQQVCCIHSAHGDVYSAPPPPPFALSMR